MDASSDKDSESARECYSDEDPEIDDNEFLSELRREALGEIKRWIRFAVERQVKNLYLGFFCGSVDASVLPPCVFTSKYLVKLYIYGCGIKHVSRVHMESLKRMSLEHIEISNEVFTELVSGCPSLQEVEIKDQFGLNEIRFTAPNIESLFLNEANACSLDCPNLKDLCIHGSLPELVDVSSLREVSTCTISKKLVNMFCNVEVFKFHTSQALISEKLYLPPTRWKSLHIESPLHEKQILGICKVLRSSPHLEVLKLYSYPHLHETKDCKMISPELFPPCMMTQLKTVTMSGYKLPCQGLVRYAEFLLKSAVALEKMEIVIGKKSKKLTEVEEVEIVMQLSSFLRASTNAKVIFDAKIC